MIRIASALVLTLHAFAMSAYAASGPPAGPPPPPEVVCITVQRQAVPIEFEYVGTTEASKTVEIRARIQGFLASRDFQEGALLPEGTLLFTIDPRQFEADLNVSKARVEQAKARLRLAQQEVKRIQSVREPGAVAQADIDRLLAEQSNATAALQLAEAEQALTELNLSYTTITAPMTGLIGKAQKEIGSLVDANQNSLLAVMHKVDPIYASFRVTESEFLKWREAQAKGELILVEGEQPYLELTLVDGTRLDKRGTLNYQSPEIDTQTGNVELRGEFLNADTALRPGQYVKVHVTGFVRPNALTIPQRAVGQSPQGSYVYIVGPDDVVERRLIKPGEWTGNDWIVEDGLEAGDRVIVEGLSKVQPGATVRPVSSIASVEAKATK